MVKERIKTLRKTLKLTQDEFAMRLGITGGGVSKLENGTRNITEQMIKSICREFGVEYIWLTEGVGEMFSESDDALLDLIDQIMSGESEFAKKVFRGFAKFDTRDWQDLERLIDKLMEDVSRDNKKEAGQ